MKSFIKKLGILGSISALFIFLAQFVNPIYAQFNTPSPTPSLTAVVNLGAQASQSFTNILTNACKISQVQIAAGAVPAIIDLYDNSVTNFTYTNAQYITLTNYTTNYVTTNISPLTGVTNIFTNLVLLTTNLTVAAGTNQLPYRTYIAAANTLATYTINDINSKGISFRFNAGTNVVVLVTYRPND